MTLMNNIVRKILAVAAVICILVVSVLAWYFIEIGFDGCCGAPPNFGNNGIQSLSHLGAYIAALFLIWLTFRWAWKKRK